MGAAADFCDKDCLVWWAGFCAEVFEFAYSVEDVFFFWEKYPLVIEDARFVDDEVDDY